MKIASYFSIVTILGWSLLSLFQLWGVGIDLDIYIKVTITLFVANIAIAIVALIFKEYISEGKMKKDKFLD